MKKFLLAGVLYSSSVFSIVFIPQNLQQDGQKKSLSMANMSSCPSILGETNQNRNHNPTYVLQRKELVFSRSIKK